MQRLSAPPPRLAVTTAPPHFNALLGIPPSTGLLTQLDAIPLLHLKAHIAVFVSKIRTALSIIMKS